MKKFVLFFCWIFFIISCEPLEDPPIRFGAIQGFTFIGSTNQVLPGLQVSLPNYGDRTTDVNGYFKFENVAEGDYVVSVYQASKFLSSKPVTVKEGNVSTLSFAFEYVKPPKEDLPDFAVVDISEESSWDYFVAGKEECFFMTVENSLPESAVYHSFKQNKDYIISFNEEGLPSKVIVEDYVFLFDNFNGKKVDFAIVSPSGDIQIIREAESDFNWDIDLTSKGSKVEAVKWFGRTIGAIPCITFGAASLVSGGAAIPLALWTCGNYFLKLTSGFVEDQGVHNGFTKFVNFYSLTSTAYNCTAGLTEPSSCLVTLAQGALNEWAKKMDELEANENVHVAEASLYAGYGDIQITLTWDNTSDIDLHVIDPFGEEIYWNHKFSESGGILDYDDINGYGPENIFWPKLQAPKGTYQVFVHDFYWSGNPSSANYIVLVNAFGRTKKFTGNINLEETIHIVDFNENELKSTKSSSEISRITIKQKK